jgi:hypothetical protein
MPEVQSITLEHVSLGDLRRRYKPTHQELHPAIRRMSKNFQRDGTCHDRDILIPSGAWSIAKTLRPFFIAEVDSDLISKSAMKGAVKLYNGP